MQVSTLQSAGFHAGITERCGPEGNCEYYVTEYPRPMHATLQILHCGFKLACPCYSVAHQEHKIVLQIYTVCNICHFQQADKEAGNYLANSCMDLVNTIITKCTGMLHINKEKAMKLI